jgi:hypothetical protein
VEVANKSVKMIILVDPKKPFELTAKKTLRRATIMKEYEAEIDAAYEAFEERVLPPRTSGPLVSQEDILQFVRFTVHNAITTKIGDNDDIFAVGGGDRSGLATSLESTTLIVILSLSASRIRTHLVDRLPAAAALPTDLAFRFPSISQLSAILFTATLMSGSMGASNQQAPQPKTPTADSKETIVRFRDPKPGETPLIVIHGEP